MMLGNPLFCRGYKVNILINKHFLGGIFMIENLPCGCPAIPTDYNNIKMLLNSGESVWFDDSRCTEQEEGTGMSGFMIAHNNKILGFMYVGEDKKRAEFTLDKALWQLKQFDKFGFDFSFGKTGIEETEDEINFICGG